MRAPWYPFFLLLLLPPSMPSQIFTKHDFIRTYEQSNCLLTFNNKYISKWLMIDSFVTSVFGLYHFSPFCMGIPGYKFITLYRDAIMWSYVFVSRASRSPFDFRLCFSWRRVETLEIITYRQRRCWGLPEEGSLSAHGGRPPQPLFSLRGIPSVASGTRPLPKIRRRSLTDLPDLSFNRLFLAPWEVRVS